MAFLALDYPLGRPFISAAQVRRERPLTSAAALLVGVGSQVSAERAIAEIPGPDGRRWPVPAGIAGRVTEVMPGRHVTIEGAATILQGLVGLGAPVAAPLAQLARGESLAVVNIPAGCIIVFPQPAPLMLLQRAVTSGVYGIIAPSMSARELEAFARTDLSAVMDGQAQEPSQLGLTIMLTEGFGAVPMSAATYAMLTQHLGVMALLTGTTDPHHNIRPEVLVSAPEGSALMSLPAESALVKGARVQAVAGPLRGQRGEITHLYERGQTGSDGILTDAAVVRLEHGAIEVVPLHTLVPVG